ncbi:MAG: S1/P1 nuclease [Bdellovibrionaceae bacterium]|jgi:hypothetical protein|nr:S1/P1 nuclease [Pseudobdellovibrionaceae bacterium]
MKLVYISTLLIALGSYEYTLAWGKIGHRIIGNIAQRHLTPTTAKAVQKILDHKSLAQVSNWPDEIRSDVELSKEYSTWHYVNIPKGSTYNASKKNPKGDILTALKHFEKILKNKKSSKKELTKAISFYVHLMGDLHQPLHAGYAKDRGGNSVKVKWFHNHTNLHSVWDREIIELQKLSYTEYATELNNSIGSKKNRIMMGQPLDWMRESRKYVDKTYDLPKGKYWEYAYSYKHKSFMDQRLLKAGLRLAKKLNLIFKNQ